MEKENDPLGQRTWQMTKPLLRPYNWVHVKLGRTFEMKRKGHSQLIRNQKRPAWAKG